jgi:hypothetical protein
MQARQSTSAAAAQAVAVEEDQEDVEACFVPLSKLEVNICDHFLL